MLMAVKVLQFLVFVSVWAVYSAQYVLELKIGSEEFSDSNKVNYVILEGSKKTSPRININTNAEGLVDASLLTLNSVNKFPDLITEDYGFIYSLTIGNDGDSLQLTEVTLTDTLRSIPNKKILTSPAGWIDASSSLKLSFRVDGAWANWAVWSTCSKSCAGGSRTRSRTCDDPAPSSDGSACEGSSTQQEVCNPDPCPVNGGWTLWSDWDTCSATCGGGTYSRRRTCTNPAPSFNGDVCAGEDTQNDICNDLISCPINGGWTDWSPWSTCSALCAGGSRSASRECTNPAPAHGGLTCPGSTSKEEACNEQPCPVDGGWSSWQLLEECSKACGGGVLTYQRRCDNPAPQNGGLECVGESEKTEPCNLNNCEVDGGWSLWEKLGECSEICNEGVQRFQRRCDNPAPQYGGKECDGDLVKTEVCNNGPCKVDGGWSDWGVWTSCSVTCGSGSKTRERLCNNPPSKNGGKQCEGAPMETAVCTMANCPVNGGWTEWTNWGQCSETCGLDGTQQKSRRCANPAPQFGGNDCDGSLTESRRCPDSPSCSIDGYWLNWSEWSSCSLSCGQGSQRRTRICIHAKFGGVDCQGEAEETQDCSLLKFCPVDGGLSEWTAWSNCSKECGNGTAGRTRSCSDPAPQHGGKECTGVLKEIKTCVKVEFCPIDGGWGTWSPWSKCSVTCGNGVETKQRYCDNPRPEHGGSFCTPCRRSGTDSKGSDPLCSDLQDHNTTEWLPQVTVRKCNRTQCFDDLKDLANTLVANMLENFRNNSGNISESESMNQAFAVVDQISGLLENQLSKVEPGESVLLETKDLAIAVAKMEDTSKPQNLASDSKGTMSVGAGGGPEFIGATAKFSALDSKTFFQAGSKKATSAPVLGLKLSSGDMEINVTSKVDLGIEMPNQNAETEADLLEPLTLSHTKKIIQTIEIESQFSAVKISILLENATAMTFLFCPHQVPNTTVDAHVIVSVFPNGTSTTFFNGTLLVKPKIKWPSIEFFIPGKQVASHSLVYLVTYTSSSGASSSGSPNGVVTTPVPSSTESKGTAMKIGVACITPRAWSDKLGVWMEADLDVDEDSSIRKGKFKSNFFGTFTAEIFIAPNSIDFADVFGNFGAKLSESFVVLIVLILVVISYILVGVILWRKDRAEANLLRYEPLVDNDPSHDYSYIVSVHTSPISGAGTSANIFMNVLGKWGSGGHRRISDGWRTKPFNNGSVANFVMTTSASLGELRVLKIWHDNTGWSPSWHLEKVIIEDLQNHKMFIFMCDNWLAEDEYDNETERILPEIKSDVKYQQQFMQMKLGGVLDNHVMLTLFRNTGQSNYTRLQKVSVCVAMFFLLMISDAMFFGKDDDLPASANFKIDFGPISLTWFQIYTGIISVGITYPCVFICADLFRRTKRGRRRWTDEEVSKIKKEWNLPRGFLVVAWFLIILAISISAFFTFLYSLEWGAEKSGQWLKSFILGIFGMIFLTDPLVLLFVYVLVKKIFSARSDDNELVMVDDFIGDEAKKVLGSGDKKVQAEKVEQLRLAKINDQKMTNTFHDCLTYVVYLFLLLAIAYDSREQITYTQNTALKEYFIPSSSKFQTFHDVYDWLEEKGIPNTYPTKLYNGDERIGDDALTIAFCDCMRQGPFRLRQIRVKKNSCKLPYEIGKAFGSIPCNEGYNLNSLQKKSFDPTWAAKSEVVFNRTMYKKRHPSPPETVIDAFRYQTAEDSGGFPFEAYFGFYEGGGYIASLGLKSREANYIVKNLRNLKWMDKLTRAVLFEGTLYNWESNLFTTVQVVFEFPPSGGVIVFPSGVRTYRLYNYVGGKGMILQVMQILFIVIVALNIFRETRKLIKLRKSYFDDLWNKVELISIIISLTIILTTAIRIKLTIEAIEKMMNNKGFYVAFDNVAMWVETTCIVLGLSCFVCILRVLKFLGFNKHIAIMQATINLSASQLSSFAVVFLCFFIAFICSGHLLFALTEVNFSDVLVMGRTLFGASLGIIVFNQMFTGEYEAMNVMYYYSWATLSVFFLMSVFISILDDTYSTVLEECLYDYDKELVDHMWNKFNKLMNSVSKSTQSAIGKKPPESQSKPISSAGITLNFDETPATPRDKDDRYKQMNPSLRKKVAELNNDKMNQEELSEEVDEYYETLKSTDGILLNPENLTNLAVVPEDETLESRLPRFKSNAGEANLNRSRNINTVNQYSLDLPGLAPPLAPAFNVDMDRFDLSSGQQRKIIRTHTGNAVSISLPSEHHSGDRKKKVWKSHKSHHHYENEF